MNITSILIPAAILAGLGLVLGLILAFSSKLFAVKSDDDTVEKLSSALPGANCGSCGYTGCRAFASAVAAGKVKYSACTAADDDTLAVLAELLGQSEQLQQERTIAAVHCKGGIHAAKKYVYMGLNDCFAASQLAGGPNVCAYGCLGLGNCVRECPYGAIALKDGRAEVITNKCRSCGKCVASCPRGLISMVPVSSDVLILCSSKDKGSVLSRICDIGCLGCRACEKACPTQAITVEDNLAKIDYSKCIDCGTCVAKCPRHLIADLVKS